jgi:hypothetical protein
VKYSIPSFETPPPMPLVEDPQPPTARFNPEASAVSNYLLYIEEELAVVRLLVEEVLS